MVKTKTYHQEKFTYWPSASGSAVNMAFTLWVKKYVRLLPVVPRSREIGHVPESCRGNDAMFTHVYRHSWPMIDGDIFWATGDK